MFYFKRKINVILAADTPQEKIQLRQNEQYRFSISKQIQQKMRHLRCNFSSLKYSYQIFALYLYIIKLFFLCIATRS